MVDGDRGEPEAVELDRATVLQALEPQEGRTRGCEADEVRPDSVVEGVAAEALKRGVSSVDRHAIAVGVVGVFDEDRQRGDMIGARMSQQDVADPVCSLGGRGSRGCPRRRRSPH